jgi:hypothetical protein
MDMMQSESDRMLAEASQMRERYTKAIASVPEPSFDEITRSQNRLYDESLEKRLQLKVQTMEQRAEVEIKRRKRKEDDLRLAEQRIEQQEGTIRQLEELVEKNPKRALPARGANDSPESKRSRAVDAHLSLEAMASITPLACAPEVIQTSSGTPAKKAEIQMSSSAPEKKAVIRMSSITPAKKAEIQTSPSTRAEKADAQSIISSGEDETGTDDDGSNGTGSVASVPTSYLRFCRQSGEK